MQQGNEYILEQARNDRIKSLGFLCYNLYVDGIIIFPEMNGAVQSIKEILNCLPLNGRDSVDSNYAYIQELKLNEKLVELGCVCFNLYVDNRLFNNNILSLCDSISSINYEIANGLKIPSVYKSYDNFENLSQDDKKRTYKTHSKLKINCPYGMEPIPVNFKKCICGYRNKFEARFCGKCGAKLS